MQKRANNRSIFGCIENIYARLKNDIEDENLVEKRNQLKQYIPLEALDYYIENNLETNIEFPVLQYPTKLKSLNLEKTSEYQGKLKGVKGQYLIFEDGTVFNVRNSEGYVVSLTVSA